MGQHWAKAAKLILASTSTYLKGTCLSHKDLLSAMQAHIKHLPFWKKGAGGFFFFVEVICICYKYYVSGFTIHLGQGHS